MQKSVFQMLLDVKTRGAESIKRLGNDLQGLQGKAKNLASSFSGLSKPLIALAGIGGGAALISSIFGSRAELESQTRSLQVLTGSAEKTKQILAEIKAFGAATPFQVRELIDVTKKLKAFGIETDSLVDTTKRLGDIAGATGAELDGIATAFGQIRAKGKFQQEENLQLLERGVDLTTELKKMYGLSGDELAKAMTKGQISFDAANQALIRLTSQGGTYFGGAIAQADTLNGKLSTLQDAFITLGQNIGKVLEPLFKGILDFVTMLTNKLNSLFAEADITNQAMKNLGFDKLTRAQLYKRRGFKEQLEAEKERLRSQAATASAVEGVQFAPPLLVGTAAKGTAASKATKEMSENTKEMSVGLAIFLADLEASVAAAEQLEAEQFAAGAAIAEQLNQQDKLNESTSKYKITLDQVKDTLANQMTSAIEGLIDGTKSLGESLSGVLRQMASLFLQAGIGSFKGDDGKGGSGLLGLFANGGVIAKNKVVPFAYGGVVNKPTLFPMANGAGLMGEAGPEAILPLRRGRNGRLGVEASGGTGDIIVNVDASGSNVQGDAQQGKALGQAIGAAVQAELIKQKRPGGLLS